MTQLIIMQKRERNKNEGKEKSGNKSHAVLPSDLLQIA